MIRYDKQDLSRIINYNVIRCFYYTLTNTPLAELSDIKNKYDLVVEFLNENQKHLYYQGCFQGGTVKNFLKITEVLSTNIQKDLNNNYIAEWWDESGNL